MNNAANPAAPKHFWIVAILSLIWNAFGAFDYLMTNMRNGAYLANFPPEMITLIDEFPVWVIAAWAVGVWAALAGSIAINDDPMTRAPASARPIRDFNISTFLFCFSSDDTVSTGRAQRAVRRADVVVWVTRRDKYCFDMEA